jgi:hypothetical protein
VRALLRGTGVDAATSKRAADDAVQRLVGALARAGVAGDAIGSAPVSVEERGSSFIDTRVIVVTLAPRGVTAALHVFATSPVVSYSVSAAEADPAGGRPVLRSALAAGQREAAAFASAQGMGLSRLRTVDVTPVQVVWHGDDSWDVVDVTFTYDLRDNGSTGSDAGATEFTTYGIVSRVRLADAFRFQLFVDGTGADHAAALVAANASLDALETRLASLGVARSAFAVTETPMFGHAPQTTTTLAVTVTLDHRVDPAAAMSLAAAGGRDAYNGQAGLLNDGAERNAIVAEAQRQAIARANVVAEVGGLGGLCMTRVHVVSDPQASPDALSYWHQALAPGSVSPAPLRIESEVVVAATFQCVADRTSVPAAVARDLRTSPTSLAARGSKG